MANEEFKIPTMLYSKPELMEQCFIISQLFMCAISFCRNKLLTKAQEKNLFTE